MPPSHDHTHGTDPDAPPPSPEALSRRRRAVWLMLLLLVPVGVATLLGLFLLWPDGEPSRAQQVAETYVPPGTTYPDGRVVSAEPYECGLDESLPATCANAVVEVLEGAGAGDFQQIEVSADAYATGVAEGDILVLSRDAGAEGGPSYRFYDHERDTPIIALGLAFAIVVVAVARLRGLASLVGLAFAFVVLIQFMLPGLLSESSPTLVSLVGSAAIMFVVLYLAHGFSARTTTALVGTLFGLALVAVLGAVAVAAARLSGLGGSDETVTLNNFDPTLDFSGLVLAGVVVAGLGVLNDVTITQASAIWQLHEVDPDMTWRELYARGMAVGRDHIASTVYTIVFAYAGAALPALMLFELYSQPIWTVVTSALAEEVIRTLVSAIALVLAVPVTTAAGAFFAKAADTQAGAATERQMSALRARFAR